MKTSVLVALAAYAIPTALAFCCRPAQHGGGDYKGQCADGTTGTPCCATLKCNPWCCKCKGNCRVGPPKRECKKPDGSMLEPSSYGGDEWEYDPFAVADAAGNGNITLEQYLKYMKVEGEVWIKWFEAHDTNGDGVLTADEAG